MKILHVNDVVGVASNYVAGLRELGEFAELYQPTIGTYWYGGTRLTRLLLPYTRTKESFQLKGFVRKYKYDILHIHYASIAYMALITGLRYYLHVHGGDMLEDMYKPGFRQLTLKAISSAERVFCATPDLIDKVLPYRSDAVFIPNPLDFKDLFPKTMPNTSRKRILCISKLDRRKGMEEIIETMENLWQAEPGITLGMFSFGNNSDAYQSFIERNRHRIELIDRIPHDQMGKLINSFDIVLGQQSKIASTLTLSELESMACGRPVVVNFQYADLYPKAPPIMMSCSPEEAVNHLRYLIHNPEFSARLGQEARKWVLSTHDKKLSAQNLLTYYRN